MIEIDLTRGSNARPDPTMPPLPRFGFAIGRARATVVVTLHGELAGPAAAQIADVLDDLIRNQGNLNVVIDLRDLSGVDPAGLAVFSAAARWSDQRGGTFRLHEPSPAVSSALDAAGIVQALALAGESP